jgi:hypothetical protein
MTSIWKHCPRWKRLVRELTYLRLLSQLLGVASHFRSFSSENATMSAVGVTSTITIETSIAKSNDIWYCLPKKLRPNLMKRVIQNWTTNTMYSSYGKVFYLLPIIWIDTLRWIIGCHLSSNDVVQIDHVTWGADGCTFKPMVVRIGSSFPQCPDAVTNTAHNKDSSWRSIY